MNEHDVIRFIGRFPSKIIQPGESGSIMNTGNWKCAECGRPRPKGKSMPCICGSIAWIKGGDRNG